MITRVFFSQRRKMLKKPFNQVFNNAKEVAENLILILILDHKILNLKCILNLLKNMKV